MQHIAFIKSDSAPPAWRRVSSEDSAAAFKVAGTDRTGKGFSCWVDQVGESTSFALFWGCTDINMIRKGFFWVNWAKIEILGIRSDFKYSRGRMIVPSLSLSWVHQIKN